MTADDRPKTNGKGEVADLRRFTGVPEDVAHKGPIRPTRLSNEQLLALDLPPRPDPVRQPLLHSAWLQAFGGSNQLLAPPTFEAELVLFEDPTFQPDTLEDGIQTSRFETSLNWSGASIEADDERDFMAMVGIWTVPAMSSLPPVTDPTIPYQCSAWIGLDGQRRYFDSSLPQIGTITQADPPFGAPATAQAWTQWWDRDDTSPPKPVILSTFKVEPNDRVFAYLFVQDPLTVIMGIVNLSRPEPLPTLPMKVVSKPVPRDGPLVAPRISGTTAEWILERPLIPDTKRLANFPDYGTTSFELCLAAMSRQTGLPGLFTATERDLTAARLLRMYERLHNPERTRFISMPTRLGSSAIALTYGDTAFL